MELASLMFWSLRGYIDESMQKLASLMFRPPRGLHRRGHGQAGVSDVLVTSGSYIDEGMDRQASLMFRLVRGRNRRGHGQAGVSDVPATSEATSTRAWTGRRL